MWPVTCKRGAIEENEMATEELGGDWMKDKSNQRNLMTNQAIEVREANRSHRRRLWMTMLLYLAFFGLGLRTGVIGPSLPDFQLNTGENVDRITLIFTTASVGFAIGSILGGILVEKFNNHLLLALAVLASGVVMFLFPWCNSLAVLVLVSNLYGLAAGVLNTGGNTVCVDIWRNDSGLYMQALHFVFALGATASPLIAGPFLTPANVLITPSPTPNNHTNMSVINSTYSPIMNSSMTTYNYIDPMESLQQGKRSIDLDDTRELYADLEGELNDRRALLDLLHNRIHKDIEFRRDIAARNVTMDISPPVSPSDQAYAFDPDGNDETENIIERNFTATIPDETDDQFYQNSTNEYERKSTLWVPYTLISVYFLLLTFPFLWLFLNGPRNLRILKTKRDKAALKGKKLRLKENNSFKVCLLALLALYIFFSSEIIYGSFVYSYAIHSSHGLSKESASYLNALFWGCFAAGRGFGIVCAVFLSPRYMTIIDLIGVNISSCLLVIFGSDIIEVLWFATGLFGISFATIFPSGISWSEKYIHLTGKSTSVFMVSKSVTGVVLPLVLGQLIVVYGYDTLLYMTLAMSLGSVVMYIIMQIVASRHGKRYIKSTEDEEMVNNVEDPFSPKGSNTGAVSENL
ncbi:sodium-dependent glucose transporter 1A-like isoform X2 [Glandiceps talaboti]